MTVTETGFAPIIDRSFEELSVWELHDIVRLRCDVFVVEQDCPYPELDGRDTEPGTRHLRIDHDGDIAAYARALDDGVGADHLRTVRIGRVVTSPAHRGSGLARRIVTHICETNPDAHLVLDAQSYLVEWYSALGFVASGPEFVEDGIPHVPMRRTPSTDQVSPR